MHIQGWCRCTHLEKFSDLVVPCRPRARPCTWEGTQAWHFLGPRHTAEQCEVSGRGDANY